MSDGVRALDQRCYEQLGDRRAERDEAQHWAHLWKMKAKRERTKAHRMKLERDSWRQQRDLMYAKIQELEALVERDTQKEREAHAELMAALKAWGPDALAAASAAEVDAVQRAQEAERELETLRRDTAEVLEPFTLLEVDLGAMLHHRGVHIDAIDVARARRLYNECKETAAE